MDIDEILTPFGKELAAAAARNWCTIPQYLDAVKREALNHVERLGAPVGLTVEIVSVAMAENMREALPLAQPSGFSAADANRLLNHFVTTLGNRIAKVWAAGGFKVETLHTHLWDRVDFLNAIGVSSFEIGELEKYMDEDERIIWAKITPRRWPTSKERTITREDLMERHPRDVWPHQWRRRFTPESVIAEKEHDIEARRQADAAPRDYGRMLTERETE
jgi:hypothetical protein